MVKSDSEYELIEALEQFLVSVFVFYNNDLEKNVDLKVAYRNLKKEIFYAKLKLKKGEKENE